MMYTYTSLGSGELLYGWVNFRGENKNENAGRPRTMYNLVLCSYNELCMNYVPKRYENVHCTYCVLFSSRSRQKTDGVETLYLYLE